jgi:hypothetical protein
VGGESWGAVCWELKPCREVTDMCSREAGIIIVVVFLGFRFSFFFFLFSFFFFAVL